MSLDLKAVLASISSSQNLQVLGFFFLLRPWTFHFYFESKKKVGFQYCFKKPFVLFWSIHKSLSLKFYPPSNYYKIIFSINASFLHKIFFNFISLLPLIFTCISSLISPSNGFHSVQLSLVIFWKNEMKLCFANCITHLHWALFSVVGF